MLPDDLLKVLKTVYKPIVMDDTPKVYEEFYSAKLFVLSYREITAKNSGATVLDEGSTYAYYKGSGDAEANRMKHQVKWHEDAATSSTEITEGGYKGASNYAGYNNNDDPANGSYMWLRSPYIDYKDRAWIVTFKGYATTGHSIYDHLYPIAPAFCI